MRHTSKSHSTKPSMMSRLTGGRRGGTTKTTVVTTTDHHHGGLTGNHHHHNNGGLTGTHHNHHTGGGLTGTTHHHQRRPSFGDKISGGWLKLKGSIMHRPGLKAAGTRRQRGTDGRGSRRNYY